MDFQFSMGVLLNSKVKKGTSKERILDVTLMSHPAISLLSISSAAFFIHSYTAIIVILQYVGNLGA